MSTRSNIGVGPLEKFKGFYIHSDGYPDTKIPELVAWLWKNSFSQFVKTVNKTKGSGGPGFDGSLDPNSLVDSPFDDGPNEHITGRAAIDQEYAYVVMSDKIDVYNWGKKLGTVEWKNGGRAAIKFVFSPKIPKWIIDDGIYYIIGHGVYKEWEKENGK